MRRLQKVALSVVAVALVLVCIAILKQEGLDNAEKILSIGGILFGVVFQLLMMRQGGRKDGAPAGTWSLSSVPVFTAVVAVMLLAVAGGIAFITLHGQPDEHTSPVAPATPSATAGPTAAPTGPMITPAATHTCAGSGSADVSIAGVRSSDGEPGIGRSFDVDVETNVQASAGHARYLISWETDAGDPPHDVYTARARLDPGLVRQTFVIQLPNSPVGAKRILFVQDADPTAKDKMEDNLDHVGDYSWDVNRLRLPVGTTKVSNTCSVTKTR